MKVLVLGSGGREHALASRLLASPSCSEVFLLPGNPGMEKDNGLKLIPGNLKNFEDIRSKAHEVGANLIVVGPEAPLVDGLVNFLEKEFSVYGPSKSAAQLEGSKAYSKLFMQENEIPTADFVICETYQQAKTALEKWDMDQGIVIKSDSLAAGKGVVVTFDRDEAEKTLFDFMENPDCTVKTDVVVLEKVLKGKEVSVFAICDGKNYFLLGKACDYKRVGEGDIGPNTGGMGCYTPHNWPSEIAMKTVEEKVIQKVLDGMQKRGTPFKGTLFCGLMVDGDDVNVVEFNVRFGDPETQTLLPVVEGDFAQLLLASANGKIADLDNDIKLSNKTSVHVVLASGGYPSIDGTPMDLGNVIKSEVDGLNNDAQVFFAGVKLENGQLVNSGGRVLGVTALGESLPDARNKAYQLVEKINFTGMHYRGDIGKID